MSELYFQRQADGSVIGLSAGAWLARLPAGGPQLRAFRVQSAIVIEPDFREHPAPRVVLGDELQGTWA